MAVCFHCFRCNWTRRRSDDFKSHSDGTCWFETMHDRWLYHTKAVSADHVRETLRGLKVFIDIQVEPGGLFVSKSDCLKRPGARVSL